MWKRPQRENREQEVRTDTSTHPIRHQGSHAEPMHRMTPKESVPGLRVSRHICTGRRGMGQRLLHRDVSAGVPPCYSDILPLPPSYKEGWAASDFQLGPWLPKEFLVI